MRERLRDLFSQKPRKSSVDTTFTLKNLQGLCAELLALEGTLSSSARALRVARDLSIELSPALRAASRRRVQQETQLITTLKTIAELMVYGDRHNEAFMEHFCEKAIPALVVQVLRQSACTNAVEIQILQTWSILFQNVKSEMFLFYMLSNNNINLLILNEFDFEDEDVIAEYISLLKILSLKLNVETVQFFLNETTSAEMPQRFPLFTAAVRHFRHRNPMVRTGAQTVILSVYAVGKVDAAVERFAIGTESKEFCISLIALLRKQVLHLMRVTSLRGAATAAAAAAAAATGDAAAAAAAAAAAKADAASHLQQMQALFDQHVDSMYCIQDVFQTGLAPLNALLTAVLIDGCITPVLLASIQHHVGGSAFPLAPQRQQRDRHDKRSQSITETADRGLLVAGEAAATEGSRDRASTWTAKSPRIEGRDVGAAAAAAADSAAALDSPRSQPTAAQTEEDVLMMQEIARTKAGEVELVTLPLALIVLTGFFLAVDHASTVRTVATLLLAPSAGGAIGIALPSKTSAVTVGSTSTRSRTESNVFGSDTNAMVVRCLLQCVEPEVNESLLISIASLVLAIVGNRAVVVEEEELEAELAAEKVEMVKKEDRKVSVRTLLRNVASMRSAGGGDDAIGRLLATLQRPLFRHRVALQLTCHLIELLSNGGAVGEKASDQTSLLAPAHRARLDEAYHSAARAFRLASNNVEGAAVALTTPSPTKTSKRQLDVVRVVKEELFRTLRGRLGLELPGARGNRPLLKRIVGRAGLLLPIEQQVPAPASKGEDLAQSFHAFLILHALYHRVATGAPKPVDGHDASDDVDDAAALDAGSDDAGSDAAGSGEMKYDLDNVLRQLQPQIPLATRQGATMALTEGAYVVCSLVPPAQTKLGQQASPGAGTPSPSRFQRRQAKRPPMPARRRIALPLDEVAFIIADPARKGSGGGGGGGGGGRGNSSSSSSSSSAPPTSATVMGAALMEHTSVKMDTREPRAMHITCLSRSRIEHAWCVVILSPSPPPACCDPDCDSLNSYPSPSLSFLYFLRSYAASCQAAVAQALSASLTRSPASCGSGASCCSSTRWRIGT